MSATSFNRELRIDDLSAIEHSLHREEHYRTTRFTMKRKTKASEKGGNNRLKCQYCRQRIQQENYSYHLLNLCRPFLRTLAQRGPVTVGDTKPEDLRAICTTIAAEVEGLTESMQEVFIVWMMGYYQTRDRKVGVDRRNPDDAFYRAYRGGTSDSNRRRH
jgi:ribosomal protein S14